MNEGEGAEGARKMLILPNKDYCECYMVTCRLASGTIPKYHCYKTNFLLN
jgi:hypothetical protein